MWNDAADLNEADPMEDALNSKIYCGDQSQIQPPLAPLSPQQKARMEHQKQMALARQRARRQSQESNEGSHPMRAEKSEQVSTIPNYSQGFKDLQQELRILKNHSDKGYCEACKPTRGGPITLSKEQVRVLQAIAAGESVFVTGSAGTGKSYLLGFAVKVLKQIHGGKSVFVTASTGLAACALNGKTLHSFAGVIPGKENKQTMLGKVKGKKTAVKRWKKARALIIDEISMIDGEFFDQLDYIARELRQPEGKRKAWGGLQLVVTGDFFQLPPVKPPNPSKFFAFEADCWNECFDRQIELRYIFRQSDSQLIDMLQEIRRGSRNRRILAKLNKCLGPPETQNVAVTRLYPRNDDVRRENEEKLKALGQEIITFRAQDVGEEHAKDQLNSGMAPKEIGLCLGAQVMLIKNIETETGLVNGATGTIIEFVTESLSSYVSPRGLWPKVRFLCGIEKKLGPESWSVMEGEKELAKRTQVPLILAWALSVHKCQGMTLDRVETNLSRAFDFGMVYVALSRVKSLDGLRLTGFDPSTIKAHPKVLDFYQKFRHQDGNFDDHQRH